MKAALCLCVFAIAALGARAQVLIFDDFEDGPDPAWGNEFGDWVAPAGEYYASIPGNMPTTYSLLPDVVGDVDFVVDVRQVGDGGIWIHSDSTRSNGILLVIAGDSGTYPGFYWHIVTDNAFSLALERSGSVFTLGSDISIRVKVRGNIHEVFLNGSPTPSTTLVTAAFPSGRVGLYDNSSPRMRFDNVLVSVPCGADYNEDTEVDILDFLDFIDDFSICEQQPAPCGNFGNPDLNGDTLIDILDFLDFMDAFGNGC